jgi:hypothetical protein
MSNGLMKSLIRSLKILAPVVDVVLAPFTLLATLWFRVARYWGVKNLFFTRRIFMRLGMFPIVDHYYDPLFDSRKLPAGVPRSHLDMNDSVQLEFIRSLNFGDELSKFAKRKEGTSYHYGNGSFGTGDADLYYSIIRKNKPGRILEIGSGFSTLLCLEAVNRNKADDPGYSCDVTCVEPYEMPFLEELNINLLRRKVEDVDTKVFRELEAGDILFVDSSHIIRPGGDVNYVILKILPELPTGTWIHFHDIFLPREYPVEWLRDEFRMWNEQYLLEAFLLGNVSFRIMAALNYLQRKYPGEVAKAFPVMATEVEREPGSFWIIKR